MLPPLQGVSPTKGVAPICPSGNARLLTWDGANPIGCAPSISADANDNLNIGGTVTIGGAATLGAACTPNGTLGSGNAGIILNCVNGSWVKLGGLSASTEGPIICDLDVWPIAPATRINCSGGGNLVSSSGAGTNTMSLTWTTNNAHTLCVMSAFSPNGTPATCQIDGTPGAIWTMTLSSFKGDPFCRMTCYD